jgi:hypothetical protein
LCQAANLLNPNSALSYRIDLVLTRGAVSVEDIKLVGDQPSMYYRRSSVLRGAHEPVGGFLAGRPDINLESERFAARARLRSARDND